MASPASAGKAASSITFCVVSLTATFSAPLFPAGGVATGAAASHADASLLAFSISAFQGFDGTENHESLGAFVVGSAFFTTRTFATTPAGQASAPLLTPPNSA